MYNSLIFSSLKNHLNFTLQYALEAKSIPDLSFEYFLGMASGNRQDVFLLKKDRFLT